MYDVFRPDIQALWSVLEPQLVAEGLAAERLDIVWPDDDLLAYQNSNKMLLTQACGYPLMTQFSDRAQKIKKKTEALPGAMDRL